MIRVATRISSLALLSMSAALAIPASAKAAETLGRPRRTQLYIHRVHGNTLDRDHQVTRPRLGHVHVLRRQNRGRAGLGVTDCFHHSGPLPHWLRPKYFFRLR